MSFLLIMTLNALSFSALLLLVSSGFSLIFGLMRIPNMAHGSFFLLGGYIGTQAPNAGTPFVLACAASALCLAALGFVTERFLLRRLQGRESGQLLATLGLSFVFASVCLMVWGGTPLQAPVPAFASRALHLGALVFPAYRVLLVFSAIVASVLLWIFIDRTRLGAMIRAGVDDASMAQAVGIRVSGLFTVVFCIGASLAGMAGTLAAPLLSVYPGLDAEMVSMALVVVIVGGIGSLTGAIVGSLAVGFVYAFGQALFTEYASVVLFGAMIFVLAVRPQGLLGRSS